MRRALAIAPAVVLLAAAPSLAADATVKVGDDFFQSDTIDDINDKVEVQPGDTVTWNWEGVDEHNVVTTPNKKQLEHFRSGLESGTGKTFNHRFVYAGRFSYLCTEHIDTMKGTVIVGSDDNVAPKLTKLKAAGGASAVKVSFKLSERSIVTLRLSGAKSKKVVKVLGAGKRSIRVKHLPAGDYKAKLTAKDGFANSSGKKSKSFSVG
jgi:plastocyanin